MINVRVPATSANLGPGFDCLGITLNLYNNIGLEEYDRVEIVSLDEIDIPTDASNLIYSSAYTLYKECGKNLCGLRIKQENNIPISRGLGSSSACIVAGLVGANEMLGTPLNKNELADLAVKIEGHPDNVVPALCGGLTISAIEYDKTYYQKIMPPDNLNFIAFIPSFKVSTTIARRALKKYCKLDDAVYNISRVALFVSSIVSGNTESLNIAVKDKLHQLYRLRLIPNGQQVFETIAEFGSIPTYLSGSGPTVISILEKDKTKDFTTNIKERLCQKGIYNWDIKVLKVSESGAEVIT